MRAFTFLLTLATVALGAALPVRSEPVCGQLYRIVAGDTLSAIAERVFGATNRWLEIYEYASNAAAIGSNPNLLALNTTISIPPCSDGPSSAAPVIERSEFVPSHDDGFVPTIQIVTAGDYLPFTDDQADGRGMLTQVVEAALTESGLPNDFEIDFVNDWSSHLTILLPKGKYDFGFPWFKPDCSDRSALPADMRLRCDYAWSDPLYTVSIAFYAPEGLESYPASFQELHGAKICRPEGYYTFDLSNEGLYDGQNITLVRPSTVDGCFVALDRGEVDFVSLNRFTAERALARAGLTGLVKPLETLVTVLDLHLVAHRDNMLAAHKWMAGFNDGLRQIQASGMFGRITSYHLRKYREELAELSPQ